MVEDLTTNQKGAIAETMISAEAVRLGLIVYRPIVEGGRADMIFDVAGRLLRVQCKWGHRDGSVIKVGLRTCRSTPRGYVRSSYSADEVDGIAAYCSDVGEYYWLPIGEFAGQTHIHLRLGPTRNNQRQLVKWAADYPFGAVAQLEERRHGMAEARGSSPLSSIDNLRPLF